MNIERIPLKYFVGLLVIILIVILFFGLSPKDYNFTNGVSWIKDGPGLRFGKYGIVYTKPFLDSLDKNVTDPAGFSFEIVLRPESYSDGRFSFILALHNGNNNKQLLMGQWRSSLIVMNGDDYAHKRGITRLGVDMASQPRTERFFTITTGKEGTNIFMDGELARSKKDLILKIPDGEKTRLLLGNSAQGRHFWQGAIYGLAFYRHTLSANDAARHFKEWTKYRNLSFVQSAKPSVLYVLDDKEGQKAIDSVSGNHNLLIPHKIRILEKEILSLPWEIFESRKSDFIDAILNFAGFMPFGFVMAALLVKIGGIVRKHNILITVALGFIFSLSIEITQAWLPSRSSSLLDLILNTLGTMSGAMVCIFLCLCPSGKAKSEKQVVS